MRIEIKSKKELPNLEVPFAFVDSANQRNKIGELKRKYKSKLD